MYLKAWSQGNKIWSYPLVVPDSRVPTWRKESIKNTAFRKDLYIRIDENRELDDIEHYFDKEIEAPAMLPLKKAIEGEVLTNEDIHRLVRFVAAQSIRTPAWYLKNYPNWMKTLPSIFENTLNDISKELSELSTLETPLLDELPQVENDTLTELFPIKVTRTGIQEDNKEFISVESIIGKGMWFFFMKRLTDHTYKILLEHDWKVISAAQGINWPTSDDPVICLSYYGKDNYDFGGGWGRNGCEIFLPISPNKILYTQVGEKITFNQFDIRTSELVEKLIIEHAHRKVYGISPNGKVKSIRGRIESSAVYNDEIQEFNNWHTKYMESEKEYTQHAKSMLDEEQ